jgi:Rrf2 family iron-sulfur cluster assembly transcriptional regulator
MTHNLWTSLNQRMYEYLSSVHLAQLVDEQRNRPECAIAIEPRTTARRPRRMTVVATAF